MHDTDGSTMQAPPSEAEVQVHVSRRSDESEGHPVDPKARGAGSRSTRDRQPRNGPGRPNRDPGPSSRRGQDMLSGAARSSVPTLGLSGAHASREGLIREPPRERFRRVLAVIALVVSTTAVVTIVLSRVLSVGGVVRTAAPGGKPVVLARMTLAPTTVQPTAGGSAAVMRSGARLVLLIQAHGLAPNGHDVYAVWLNTSGGSNQLLGLVAPPVGRAGTFSSGAALPGNALSFSSLLLTRETTTRPARPGQLILSSPITAH